MKILLIIFGIILGLILLFMAGLTILSKQPAVKKNYWNDVDAVGELEQKYTQPGRFSVTKVIYDSGNEK